MSGRERWKRYYAKNAAKVAERIRAYRADDPDGYKARRRYLSKLLYRYMKKRDYKTGVKLYVAMHQISDDDIYEITTSLKDILQEAEDLVRYGLHYLP